MKISELWLRDFIKIPLNSEKLIEQMISNGIQVNKVKNYSEYYKDSFNIIIGKVINCKIHNFNKNLYIIKIKILKQKYINIIYYKKLQKNLKIAVAKVGSVLNGKKIIPFNINGIISEGKIFFFKNYEIFFPNNAPIGIDIKKYLRINDNIIDIIYSKYNNISIFNISKYIANINNIHPTLIKIAPINPIINNIININFKFKKIFFLYLSRIIKNLNLNIITPFWIIEKLRRIGIKSINILIDIINYIFQEFGILIYIIDLKNIFNKDIFIRLSELNEIFSINNIKYIINDMLVISDSKKILLPMVKEYYGIKNTFLYKKNIDILISCIILNNNFIISHNKLINNYDKYIFLNDFSLARLAIEKITYILNILCKGKSAPIVYLKNIQKNIFIKKVYKIFIKNINNILGNYITYNEILNILNNIGCKNIINKKNILIFNPPTGRFDLEIEEDYIEEILRIYGYNKIPRIKNKNNINFKIQKIKKNSIYYFKNIMVNIGYQEIINYSLVNPKLQVLLFPNKKFIKLKDFFNIDMSVLRISLLTGLLNKLKFNLNYQEKHIKIFEIGFIFNNTPKNNIEIIEELMLAGIITGKNNKKYFDYYDAKGDIENILYSAGKIDLIKFKNFTHTALHPKQCASIYLNNNKIGYIGRINPILENKLNLPKTIFFEIKLDKITLLNKYKYKNISKLPINRRDISIIIPDNIKFSDLIKECKKILGLNLIRIKFLNLYNKNITKGYKGIAFSLYLQKFNKQLNKKEINNLLSKCISQITKKFSAKLKI